MVRHRPLSRFLFPALAAAALLLLLVPEHKAWMWRSRVLSVFRPMLEAASGFRREAAELEVASRSTAGSGGGDVSRVGKNRYEQEIGALRAEIIRLRDENARLRSALPRGRRAERLPEGISADVVTRRVLWGESLWGLNRGDADGVRVGAGVLTGGTVLGRIVAVGPQASSLALLTHRGATLAVRLADSRLTGTLRGVSEREDGRRVCRLSLIKRKPRVRIGEHVVTSGLDGVFPPGLWVGTITRAEKKKTGHWELTVKPAVDFERTAVVRVLTEVPPEVPWPENPFRRKKKTR